MKRTRIKPVNPERKAKMYRRNYSGPYGDHSSYIRSLPCSIKDHQGHLCYGDSQACHVRVRGMGGAKGKWSDLVPLCRRGHLQLDVTCANKAEAFKELYGVDLEALADTLAEFTRREWEDKAASRVEGYER